MFRRSLYLTILTALLLGSLSFELKGQDAGVVRYQSEAKEHSLLYRGRVERKYVYRYQGTYFAYSDKYYEGEVFYNGRHYKNILVNLNAHTDEVSVRMSDKQLPVVLDKNHVEWFIIAGRRFVNYRDGAVPGLAGGYYEVLYYRDGKGLIKKIAKKYKENLERDVVMVEFITKINYYVLANGMCKEVKGQSGFIKVFPESKKMFRSVYREASSTVRENKDRLFIMFMEVAQ